MREKEKTKDVISTPFLGAGEAMRREKSLHMIHPEISRTVKPSSK